MNTRTKRLKQYRSCMAEVILNNPEAKKVENRYRLIRKVLMEVYPKTLSEIPKETLMEILKDADYIGRQARLFNEGNQKELKEQLMAEKLVELHS